MFFAPTQKKKKDKDDGAGGEPADDFLDSIFASRRNVNDAPPLPPPGDDGLDMEEDLGRNKDPGLDDLFAKPVETKKPNKGHMPARGGSPNKMPGGDIVPDEENFDDFF